MHYVMSDLHGEKDRFDAMLKLINFSIEDKLFILGDVLDRGPEPIALLRQIMSMPNVQMLLGNHEHMCLEYYKVDPEPVAIRRWDKNNNQVTKDGLASLSVFQRAEVFDYMKNLPLNLEIEVAGKKYHLVHGFVGDNLHDQVWGRPYDCTQKPFEDKTVIIGHTPVIEFIERDEEKQMQILESLAKENKHLEILYSPYFINIDCCCGYYVPAKALACLRLEDMKQFYC